MRAATRGADVRVYRVPSPRGGARVEYWLVAVEPPSAEEKKGKGKGARGRLVGVKALAVES